MDQESKEELKQIVKEYLDSARQSGKSETSGLVSVILKQIDGAIENSVKKHVNGKISDIQETLDNMNKKINPMFDIFASVNGFDKVAVWILKGLAMIGTAILSLYVLIEFFKKLGK